MLKWQVNMEALGVHLHLQEDFLDNYTISVSEIEQNKHVPRTGVCVWGNPSFSQAIKKQTPNFY